MGFLRRLLGGAEGGSPGSAADASGEDRSSAAPPGGWTDDDERGHELELARFEQERTTDLVRRQQQYADRSWTPPAQGGTKRAGAEDDDR